MTNPSDGGFFYWLLRFYAFGLCCVLGLAFLTGVGVYFHFAGSLPPIPDLATYHDVAATTTVMRGWDGTPLAELATERREILPFDRFPPQLVHAFLAAEDRRFYEHQGIDYRGIARALGANLRAGEVAQGGSTITQQVAKSFLSSERTIQRKIREAILARRLERKYSKREILTLYLNQVFLGHGAYGVAAAARIYFDKPIEDLDVGEMALLAGLVRAPSRFSPLTSIDAARTRRDQVLAAMVASGYLTDDEANHWRARPITIRQRPDFFHTVTPYFTEQVRRDIIRRYGEKKLYEGGLDIETSVLPWVDVAGQENVDFSLRKLDKRQGWRGPVARLTGAAADELRRRVAAQYGGEPPAEGRLYLGLVEGATADGSYRVRVGKNVYRLPSANMLWAVPWSARDAVNDRKLESTVGVLRAGDVVWVKNAHQSKRARFSDWTYDGKSEVQWLPAYDETAPGKAPKHPHPVELTLEQTPRVQGTVFSYDHDSGYVVAMVGGDDYDRSEFNRVSQACRQPGSVYKPIYYSLALDRGYGFGSLLNDVPRAEVDPITGEVWTPTNLNNTVDYQVTLEYALIWSKNVPAVQLFKLMGGKDVEAWARRLGITTPIIPDQALALGASCTRIDELTRAFSAFAREGRIVEPVYVRRVRNRDRRRRRGPHVDRRSVRHTVGAARPPAGPGRHAAPQAGHPAAHRLAHLDAAPPRRHPRPRARHPDGGSAGGRQDRDVERHHGHLVHRLHLALDDVDLDRRRSPRARPRPEGRGVHADRPHVRALPDRGDGQAAAARHPLGAPGRRQIRRHRRQAAHDDGGGAGRRPDRRRHRRAQADAGHAPGAAWAADGSAVCANAVAHDDPGVRPGSRVPIQSVSRRAEAPPGAPAPSGRRRRPPGWGRRTIVASPRLRSGRAGRRWRGARCDESRRTGRGPRPFPPTAPSTRAR